MEHTGEQRVGATWRQPPLRWVAHVDMDAFFASVEQLDRPELKALPVIVGNSPLSMDTLREMAQQARKMPNPPEFIKGMRGVVASASYEARAFGVRSAQPLARALVLCPDAVVLLGRFDRYREMAALLRAVWGEFSPVIEPMSLDEAYLDMTGCELYGGPVMGIGERLKERIVGATGLTASVGIASGKLMAKIASDMDKPDGLVVVRHGDEARMLAPLPVRALPGVGPRTAEALYALGISYVGQLAAYNEDRLAALFGLEQSAGLKRRALGVDPSPVQPPGDPKSISRETTLVDDESDLDELKSVLRLLSDRVGWQLRNEGFQARCIFIKLRLLPKARVWTPSDSSFGRLITRRVTLWAATDSGETISKTASGLLDGVARATGLGTGKERVRLVGVGTASLQHNGAAATATARAGRLDEHLQMETVPFDVEPESSPPAAGKQTRESKLNASLDSIRGRFGFHAISLAAGVTRPKIDASDNLVE